MFNKKLKEEVHFLQCDLNHAERMVEILKGRLDEYEKPSEDLPWANHEMTTEERTQKAKEILGNPLMMEIFKGIEHGLTQQAKHADLSNHYELICYTQGLQILDQMVNYIQDRINDEKVIEYNQKLAKTASMRH